MRIQFRVKPGDAEGPLRFPARQVVGRLESEPGGFVEPEIVPDRGPVGFECPLEIIGCEQQVTENPVRPRKRRVDGGCLFQRRATESRIDAVVEAACEERAQRVVLLGQQFANREVGCRVQVPGGNFEIAPDLRRYLVDQFHRIR